MNFARAFLLLWVAVVLLGNNSSVIALEGALTSDDGEWSGAPATKQSSQTEREKELAARKADMEAEKKMLQERLKRAVNSQKKQQLFAELNKVKKAYGWVPSQELVYGIRSFEPILNGQDEIPPSLMKAFVQLKKDLDARGVDLIVLPLAPTPFFASHELLDGVGPEDEIYPGWTKMMLQFLENDIEVVDSLSEYRNESSNQVLVSWVNDFHTGSLGRQIAARKLAERLQRYQFARELKGNVGQWKVTEHTKTGAMFPQRITTVNGMLSRLKKDKVKPGMVTYPMKHPGRVSVLKADAPEGIVEKLKNREFKYLKLQRPGNWKKLRRSELIMFGDSQLHSAVYGSGMPEFINMEVGGVFRWGSKSWSGFSPPEIYQRIVPDNASQPKVAVMVFLPKYFWAEKDRRGKMTFSTKYSPRPMPAYKGKTPVQATATAKEFEATVRVIKVSKQKADPSKLDYDEALGQISARVTKGPKEWRGKTILITHWTMHDGENIEAAAKIRPGRTLKLKLTDWISATKKEKGISQHMIFNDTGLDMLSTPNFWAIDGPLSSKALLSK